MSTFKHNMHLLPVTQPIGTFYIGVIKAPLLKKISEINRRKDGKGPQREESQKRIKEIENFTYEIDAVFPTPIVLAVKNHGDYHFENNSISFNDNEKLVEIIDGQHRTEGIFNSSKIDNFQLPVILLFDLTEEEKAYIFSIINSKQTKVSMSLIYDLFSISKNRSPQKTCHEIARLFNTDKQSPFYKKLKMLGKKEGENSSLSQGSFIRYLLPLISKKPDEDLSALKRNPDIMLEDNPKCPLRFYFIKSQDEIIYKILFNYFSAVANVFEKEWNNPNEYILSKTTGYGALLKAFPKIYGLGVERKTLTYDFFFECFTKFKELLDLESKELTSKYFASNEQEQRNLANLILLSNKISLSSHE